MPIRPFAGHAPQIAASAYVDATAVVIGAVEIGADASIWPLCVVRGDVQSIHIGARSNVQDGTVIHVTHDSRFCPGGLPTRIGHDVTIGHQAMLHACTIGDFCLIGMGAIVMDGAVLDRHVMLGAGSVVGPGKHLEGGYLYVGSPAQRMRPLSEREREFLAYSAENYVRLKEQHRAG
ncbi:carbonic anhydrase/acetyltransferase-like protein (isoleucine patch superfamily) [Plasticicumulans lactativorans]|uniref:Carbonic anhydrase/acetyltransferase-like protein (Isoleucine patch superfamily) n=1 Tax=Plasticicumulans lactativorans TaxID=1133106 RepID=A0A4R2L8Y3_9GAMM|nr:gamma carbonic anhydrase family protein [Plasticicumulans lactativorans]TCO81776.1 carbonic anhydrase/acetyltransferase-like protein (isoleucine patch superfamily) [Plasticicumulans lactativorans]